MSSDGVKPKNFQNATIQAAMKAFTDKSGSRRFLVADEVGLGKTVVARGVIKEMLKSRSKPLKVFYMCSSLAIASQNRDSLLKALKPKQRKGSSCNVDRLTLVPQADLSSKAKMHLLTLTPDTSAPDQSGKRRDGHKTERALIHILLQAKYPSLVTRPNGQDWLQREARKSWPQAKLKAAKDLKTTNIRASQLLKQFLAEARVQFGLRPGQRLAKGIKSQLKADELEAIKLLRIALARAGLERLKPDLIIFDEFQRFSSLLYGNGRSSDIIRHMLRPGPGGPAVLLLSATPYKLYGGDLKTAFNQTSQQSPQTHHAQFFELIEWLLGGPNNLVAEHQRQALEAQFHRYGQGLRGDDPLGQETLSAKAAIESCLRTIIARTERFGHVEGRDIAQQIELAAPLKPDDLQVYQHLLDCFRGHNKGSHQGRPISAAVQYWTSVPLPMQTLGSGYKPWKESARLPPPSPTLTVTEKSRNAFEGPYSWPHPRLRALQKLLPPERLALPWSAPSMPWWPLDGPWSPSSTSNHPNKVLIFSRFKATPRSVAALMSYDLERWLLKDKDITYSKVAERVLLGPSRPNIAFFHPSPALIEMLDPQRFKAKDWKDLPQEACTHLRRALNKLNIKIQRRDAHPTQTRPYSELIVALERRQGCWGASLEAWRKLAAEVGKQGSDGKGLMKQVNDWDKASSNPLSSITCEELEVLATQALGGAGVVIGRSLSRHGVPIAGTNQSSHIHTALRTSWVGLRSYLNNPWMDAALRRTLVDLPPSQDYRSIITEAIQRSNLESSLDEHLWVTKMLRGFEAEALAQNLTEALSLRTANFVFHGPVVNGESKDTRLRAHAAIPFSDQSSPHSNSATERSASARQDDLRTAFNSPFWPHVLASTSVGQEGLDFHAWCASVAHWDLPSSPVDLEQREGRVDRYAGLATRRALAKQRGHSPVRAGKSPWEKLYKQISKTPADPAGLVPWWICHGATIRRIIFDVPMSQERQRLERLKAQRLLYRLTLGQPDQEELVKALDGRLGREEALKATLVLSPWRSTQ